MALCAALATGLDRVGPNEPGQCIAVRGVAVTVGGGGGQLGRDETSSHVTDVKLGDAVDLDAGIGIGAVIIRGFEVASVVQGLGGIGDTIHGLGHAPVVINSAVQTGGIPGMWGGDSDVWKTVALGVSERAEFGVGKSASDGEGHPMSFKGFDVGLVP